MGSESLGTDDSPIKVVVWGENVHERTNELVRSVYPDGMHSVIADALNEDPAINAATATLDQPEHGLTADLLDRTDVLTWWGHAAHGEVADEIVDRVHKRVLEGMGLIVLHSGHYSKIFKRLMGTSCSLCWREAGEKERLWVCQPSHPICQGLDRYVEIPNAEMYGEPFGIPVPDEQIFISWFEGGEVFRSGATWKRGNGKVFYFRPGHETYPIYYQKEIRMILRNAVRWAAPKTERWIDDAPNIPVEQAPEKIEVKGRTLHAPGERGYR